MHTAKHTVGVRKWARKIAFRRFFIHLPANKKTFSPKLQNVFQLNFKFCAIHAESWVSFEVVLTLKAEEVKCYKKMRKSFDEEFCTSEDYDRFFNLTTKEKDIFSRQIYDIFVIKFKEDKYAQSGTPFRSSMVN